MTNSPPAATTKEQSLVRKKNEISLRKMFQ